MRRSLSVLLAVLAALLLVPFTAVTPRLAEAQTESPPAPPAWVAGRSLGRDTMALHWTQSAGAVDYELWAANLATGEWIGPFHGAGVQGSIPGLVAGQPYVPAVAARNEHGTSERVLGVPIVLSNSGSPSAVTNLRAVPDPASTRLDVSWTEAPDGIQPDFYAVEVQTPTGTPVGSMLACEYPCNSRPVEGLEPGAYRVRVGAANWTNGVSWTAPTAAVTVDDGCPAGGACITVDASRNRGVPELIAQGVNAGLQNMDAAVLEPLQLRWVRIGDSPSFQTADAMASDPEVTWVLSTSWHNTTFDAARGGAAFPWDDWASYERYVANLGTWFKNLAPVDFFDVQNEPYLGYFNKPPADHPRTVEQLVDHLVHAAGAVRSGDPAAQVVGPSYVRFNEATMRLFLDEVVERGLDLSALSWHELEPGETTVNKGPNGLIEHVAQVRRLLSQRPSMQDVELHISEYGGPGDRRLSGWVAGYISAVEATDVDLAMRTCWTTEECSWYGSVAALFEPRTGKTLAPYWVHKFYAEQTGARLTSRSTNSNVSAFATRDGDTTKVLVGRHHTCAAAVNPDCRQPASMTRPAFDVPITITDLPRRANVRVVLQRVPATSAPVAQPVTVSTRTVRAANDGSLVVTLPKVADGEAWMVTVTQ